MTRPLTEAQQAYARSGTNQMSKLGMSRARQIASQRQSTPYQRAEVRCVSCLAPRDPKSHPVCDACTHKREVGLR